MDVKDMTPGKLYKVKGIVDRYFDKHGQAVYASTSLNDVSILKRSSSPIDSGFLATIEPGDIIMFVKFIVFQLGDDEEKKIDEFKNLKIIHLPIVLYKGLMGFLGYCVEFETVEYGLNLRNQRIHSR
jgi:hypothetical protein